jgi:acyl-CoA synthetase (AMP-forming)/AMP-acid ligase II
VWNAPLRSVVECSPADTDLVAGDLVQWRRKISSEEVDDAYKGHLNVFDALVVGVPDPCYGQHWDYPAGAWPASRAVFHVLQRVSM